jgi:hypothetical protein
MATESNKIYVGHLSKKTTSKDLKVEENGDERNFLLNMAMSRTST